MESLRDSDLSELMRRWSGLDTDEVAKKIGLPPATVKKHLADVNRTLTAGNRARAAQGFEEAAEAISSLETAILQLGIRLAAEVTAQAGEYSVDYLRIDGDMVTPLGAGSRPGNLSRTFPLHEHPFVSEMVATGEPRAGVLRKRKLGERAGKLAEQLGIVAGGGVPIKLKGSVHGILSLSTRGLPPSRHLLQHLAAVARILETALQHHH